MANRQESAQTVALTVLAWLVQDDDRLQAFMAAGGLAPEDLRQRAADPVMLGAVLEHLLADESLLLQFCSESGLRPEAPMQARAVLPGGDVPNWT
jgi:hypothetical protein